MALSKGDRREYASGMDRYDSGPVYHSRRKARGIIWGCGMSCLTIEHKVLEY